VRGTLDRYKEVYKYILKKGEAVIRRNSHQYEDKPNVWKPGDKCWHLSPRKIPGKSLKTTNQWVGPMEVVEWVAPVLVKIRNGGYLIKHGWYIRVASDHIMVEKMDKHPREWTWRTRTTLRLKR